MSEAERLAALEKADFRVPVDVDHVDIGHIAVACAVPDCDDGQPY